jgi:hypothetical protein
MNFSEYAFQQIQKYHTKSSDILILIFSGIVALATLVLIILNISEKMGSNVLLPSANIIILGALLFIITYVGVQIPKTNNRIHQVECVIVLNQNVIDGVTPQTKKEILELIKETLNSKKGFFPDTASKFDKLMEILDPKDQPSHNKDEMNELKKKLLIQPEMVSYNNCLILLLCCKRYNGIDRTTL